MVKPLYKIIVPAIPGGFNTQWAYCFNELQGIIRDSGYLPFRINIFISDKGKGSYQQNSHIIGNSFHSAFGSQCPPFGIATQTPEEPFKVIIEVGLVDTAKATVTYKDIDNQPYCQIETKGYKEFWIVGVQPLLASACINESAEWALGNLQFILCSLGISCNHIVRQWNYIGGILDHEPINGHFRQHYQMFNEVRHDFYKNYRNISGFPAATGIGISSTGISVDCFAVSSKDPLHIKSVSNPNQYNSYLYGQEVLKGVAGLNKKNLQPPQFERAKLLVTEKSSRLLISGTASIIGQDTVGVGDIVKQTEVTIENIDILTSQSNLAQCFPGLNNYPDTFSYIRVYVKNKADIPKVKMICSSYFGDHPTTYIQADICRDDLLVEIEGEMITS